MLHSTYCHHSTMLYNIYCHCKSCIDEWVDNNNNNTMAAHKSKDWGSIPISPAARVESACSPMTACFSCVFQFTPTSQIHVGKLISNILPLVEINGKLSWSENILQTLREILYGEGERNWWDSCLRACIVLMGWMDTVCVIQVLRRTLT